MMQALRLLTYRVWYAIFRRLVMQQILSVSNMRKSDETTVRSGISGRELMLRAGKAIYETIEKEIGFNGPVAIVCGSGNNAGDGYVIASMLKKTGKDVTLFLTGDRFSDDGRFYYEECIKAGVKIENSKVEEWDLSTFTLLIDCIYGTGFHGEVTGTIEKVITKINEASSLGSKVVSVDINSGLNGDNGMTKLCVVSDLTVSVGSFQPGHFLNMAKDVMKKAINRPIGIEPVDPPYMLFEAEDAKECFKERKNFSNKGTYGYVALLGGSSRYPGAISLAAMAEASMRSGAGVTTIACPSSLRELLMSRVLESTVFPLKECEGDIVFSEDEIRELMKNKKAIAFGMGIGQSPEVEKTLRFLLKEYPGILIVDADGLTALSKIEGDVIADSLPKLVLTPHVKEFSRLTGADVDTIFENTIPLAKRYAGDMNVYLLLKGPSTVITDGVDVYIVKEGCPGMATAGSGDVLSGILAATLGANPDNVLKAVASAAWINGRAGSLAQESFGAVSMVSGDTVAEIPTVIKDNLWKNTY